MHREEMFYHDAVVTILGKRHLANLYSIGYCFYAHIHPAEFTTLPDAPVEVTILEFEFNAEAFPNTHVKDWVIGGVAGELLRAKREARRAQGWRELLVYRALVQREGAAARFAALDDVDACSFILASHPRLDLRAAARFVTEAGRPAVGAMLTQLIETTTGKGMGMKMLNVFKGRLAGVSDDEAVSWAVSNLAACDFRAAAYIAFEADREQVGQDLIMRAAECGE